jgi:hypothetical protein
MRPLPPHQYGRLTTLALSLCCLFCITAVWVLDWRWAVTGLILLVGLAALDSRLDD